MKSHRIIWSITGCVVLLAAIVVVTREAVAPQIDPPRPAPTLSGNEAAALVDTMLACLERDPRAQRMMTRRLVEAVAALAREGSHQSAETYYALGLSEYSTGRTAAILGRAEAAFREAIARKPGWAMPYNTLGIVLHGMKRLDEAEQAFRAAQQRDPTWSRPHNDLAILYRLSGRFEEAREEALIALELAPDSVATHNNYGNLLKAMGELDEAEQAYRRAIALEPDQPAPYYNLACLASIEGDEPKALAFLTSAIVFDDAFRDEARDDPDLASIRDSEGFKRLVGGD